VRDQNGAVEIAVRTPDTQLSNSLQDGLPDLVTRLEAQGTQASATRGDQQPDSGSRDDTRQDRPPQEQHDGQQGQPREQRRQRQARWQASLGLATATR
jgi:hypothetical protein